MAKTKLQRQENGQPAMTAADVNQMLGAARYAEFLAGQSESHVLQFLMMVHEKELFLAAGFPNMDAFIEASGLKSRATYYRKRELLLKEGADQYDLFEEWRIPAATRRMLEAGDIKVNDTEVIIGDQAVPFGDSTVIKQVIERLVREKIAAANELQKANKKVVKLDAIRVKYDELQARLDEAEDKPEYVIAFMGLIESLNVLVAEASDLPGEMKGERGPLDLPQIFTLIEQLCDAYGEPLPWIRGSWNYERPNRQEQEKLAYFQSDAIDEDNF